MHNSYYCPSCDVQSNVFVPYIKNANFVCCDYTNDWCSLINFLAGCLCGDNSNIGAKGMWYTNHLKKVEHTIRVSNLQSCGNINKEKEEANNNTDEKDNNVE